MYFKTEEKAYEEEGVPSCSNEGHWSKALSFVFRFVDACLELHTQNLYQNRYPYMSSDYSLARF